MQFQGVITELLFSLLFPFFYVILREFPLKFFRVVHLKSISYIAHSHSDLWVILLVDFRGAYDLVNQVLSVVLVERLAEKLTVVRGVFCENLRSSAVVGLAWGDALPRRSRLINVLPLWRWPIVLSSLWWFVTHRVFFFVINIIIKQSKKNFKD